MTGWVNLLPNELSNYEREALAQSDGLTMRLSMPGNIYFGTRKLHSKMSHFDEKRRGRGERESLENPKPYPSLTF